MFFSETDDAYVVCKPDNLNPHRARLSERFSMRVHVSGRGCVSLSGWGWSRTSSKGSSRCLEVRVFFKFNFTFEAFLFRAKVSVHTVHRPNDSCSRTLVPVTTLSVVDSLWTKRSQNLKALIEPSPLLLKTHRVLGFP